MTYTAIMAVACEFGGVVMIPVVTHAIVEDACNMKKKNPLERKEIKVLYVVTFLYGLLWAIAVTATGQDGSFRGLYCAVTNWSSVSTAVPIFGGVGVVQSIACMYYYKTYKLFQKNQMRNSANNLAMSIVKSGVTLIVLFFIFWGPFAVTCLLNLVGVSPPIWYDMLCGVLAKAKAPVDIFYVLNLPAVKAGRSGKVVPRSIAEAEGRKGSASKVKTVVQVVGRLTSRASVTLGRAPSADSASSKGTVKSAGSTQTNDTQTEVLTQTQTETAADVAT